MMPHSAYHPNSAVCFDNLVCNRKRIVRVGLRNVHVRVELVERLIWRLRGVSGLCRNSHFNSYLSEGAVNIAEKGALPDIPIVST